MPEEDNPPQSVIANRMWLARHPALSTTIAVVGVFALVAIIGAIGGSPQQSSSSPATQIASTPSYPKGCGGRPPEAVKASAEVISYKALDKEADGFKGRLAKFTGQIVQIKEEDGVGIMRLAVTREAYGWSYSDIVFVAYEGHVGAVKDDVITVYGTISGSYTYESQAHFNITLPGMIACVTEPVSTSDTTSAPSPESVTPARPSSSATPPIAHPAPVPQQPVAPTQPATWHQVAYFTGSENKSTDTFVLKGSKARITWTANVPSDFCPDYGCRMYVYVYSTAGDLVNSFSTPDLRENGNGTSYVYSKPGEMYFQVTPGGISLWTLNVEDYY